MYTCVHTLCIYVCKYTKFVYVYKVSIYTNIKLYKELKQKNQNNLKKNIEKLNGNNKKTGNNQTEKKIVRVFLPPMHRSTPPTIRAHHVAHRAGEETRV